MRSTTRVAESNVLARQPSALAPPSAVTPSVLRLDAQQKPRLAQVATPPSSRLRPLNALEAAFSPARSAAAPALMTPALTAPRLDVELASRQGNAVERASQAVQQHLLDEVRIEQGLSTTQVKERRQERTRLEQEKRFGTAQSGRGHLLTSAGHAWAGNLHGLAQELAQVAGAKDFAQYQKAQRQEHQEASEHHQQRAIETGRVVEWEQVTQEGKYAVKGAAPVGAIESGLALSGRLGQYIESLYLQSSPYLLESLGGGFAGRAVAGGLKLSAQAVSRAGLVGAAAVSLPSSSGRVLEAQREHSQALQGKEQTHLPSALVLGGVGAAVNAVFGVDRMLAKLSTGVIHPGRLAAMSNVAGSAVQVSAVTAGEALTEVVQGFTERTGAKVASEKLRFFSMDYAHEVGAQLRDGGLMGWAGGSVGQGVRGARSVAATLQSHSSLLEAQKEKAPSIVDSAGKVLYEENSATLTPTPTQTLNSVVPGIAFLPQHLLHRMNAGHDPSDLFARGWRSPEPEPGAEGGGLANRSSAESEVSTGPSLYQAELADLKQMLTLKKNAESLPGLLRFLERVKNSGLGGITEVDRLLGDYRVNRAEITDFSSQLGIGVHSLPRYMANAFGDLNQAKAFIQQKIEAIQQAKAIKKATMPRADEFNAHLYQQVLDGHSATLQQMQDLLSRTATGVLRWSPDQIASKHQIEVSTLHDNLQALAAVLNPKKAPAAGFESLRSDFKELLSRPINSA